MMPWSWDYLSELVPGPTLTAAVDRYRSLQRSHSNPRWSDPHEAACRAQAAIRAYAATPGQPAILRRARLLTEFAAAMPVTWVPEDPFAGRQTFFLCDIPADLAAQCRALNIASNGGHVVHDYDFLLKHGIGGCLHQIKAMPHGDARTAFSEAMAAFRHYLSRWIAAAPPERAKNLRPLLDAPPSTYPQALQLIFLAQVFLHAENPASAISFGRLDHYAWPFLAADLRAGRLDATGALNWTGAFFLKCCEGGESQNLVVGGVDDLGADATNGLSLLILATMKVLRVPQPSLCVRLHPDAPSDLRRAAADLAAVGTGQPGFINDAVAIPALEAVGIPRERARDYAIVGCYEATSSGDTYANTTGCGLNLAQTLSAFLQTRAARRTRRFQTFYRAFLRRLQRDYARMLAREAQPRLDFWRDHAPSPFGSVLMRHCIEQAHAMEDGGARFNLMGVNLLGFGTVIDSLHVIRETVFRQAEWTLDELAETLAADWPDADRRRYCRHLPGRYGTDSDATNQLAADLSENIGHMVLESRLARDVRPYPGLFRFYADMGAYPWATPDGRQAGERLSYGAGPAPMTGAAATSVLNAVASVRHALFGCGNPLALSLTHRLSRRQDPASIRALVDGYFQAGGFHLHVNLADAEQLRQARANPADYADLMVRVSGFSASFVRIRPQIQDALIERAELGPSLQ